GLNERYVREWLGGMVAAEVVDFDPAASTYVLPPDHAAVLTRAAGPDNLACVAQFIPMLGEVEQRIIDCFVNGGGLPYSHYPRFHTLMAEQSGQRFDAELVDAVLPLVEGLPERLRAGADVADIGCGSGHAVNVMAQAFPASTFTGIDFSDEGLSAGRGEAQRLGLTNATFVARDVAALDMTDAYDLVTTFDAIHDQAHPARVLEAIHRALRPGGVLLMVDIKASSNVEDNRGVPLATYKYTVSTLHCMSVSLALGGEGLGTVWGRQLAESMLADAGFTDVTVVERESDPINNYYIARKP
ncbi:MAG: class I SAM-dependent methyltransferase, partial [Mycobacterium sp.]